MQFTPNSFNNQSPKKVISIVLAFLGTVTPLGGLHKFYLGQPLWGVIYLLLGWETPIIRIACAVDAVLYLIQSQDQFFLNFNSISGVSQLESESLKQQSLMAQNTIDIASAIRELEKLRQEGLISEYEFEQKRRKLVSN